MEGVEPALPEPFKEALEIGVMVAVGEGVRAPLPLPPPASTGVPLGPQVARALLAPWARLVQMESHGIRVRQDPPVSWALWVTRGSRVIWALLARRALLATRAQMELLQIQGQPVLQVIWAQQVTQVLLASLVRRVPQGFVVS